MIGCVLEKTCLGDTPEYWMMFLYLLISNGYDFVGLNYRVLVPQKWSKTSLVGEVFSWNPICPNVSPRIIKCLVVFGSVSIPGWLCKSIWAVKKDKFVVFKWCSSPTVSTGLWFHPLRVNLSYCQPGCLYGLGLNRLFLFAQVDHHLNCSRTYVYLFLDANTKISNDFLNTCYILIRCMYIYQYYLFMLFIIYIHCYMYNFIYFLYILCRSFTCQERYPHRLRGFTALDSNAVVTWSIGAPWRIIPGIVNHRENGGGAPWDGNLKNTLHIYTL